MMKKPLKSLLIFFRSLVFWCILLTVILQILNLTSGNLIMPFMDFIFAILKFSPVAVLIAIFAVFKFLIFSEANKPLTISILMILMGITVYFIIPIIFSHIKLNLPIYSYSINQIEKYRLLTSFPEIFKNTLMFITDISKKINTGMKQYLIFSIPMFFTFFMYGVFCSILTKWKMLNIVLLLTMNFGTFYAYSAITAGIASPILNKLNIAQDILIPGTFVLISGVLLAFTLILLLLRGIKSRIVQKQEAMYE